MFCPKCHAEYREGFTECSDCHVSLIDTLPVEAQEPVIEEAEIEPEFHELKLVMTSLNRGLTALAESLLQAADIPYHIQGSYYIGVDGAALPMRFLVPEECAAEAREVLGELL